MAALRWGILGAGKISHDFVVGLKTHPPEHHRAVAVASRSQATASAFAETHGIEKTFTSYEDLANDPEVDIVYVGNIHPYHVPAVLSTFEAKKPVLCEKPLTMNADDTSRLISVAKEKNLFFMEAVWMRFFPAIAELRSQIRDGKIGDVQYVYVSLGYVRPPEVERLIDPKLGGGGMLSLGIYTINFATMIFGGEEPENIHASGWLASTGVDEVAAITLKYSGQRVAQLMCSIAYNTPNEAIVLGTKGQLKLHAPFWCPTKLDTPEGTKEFPLPEPYLPTKFQNSSGLGYEAEEVRTCLREGRTESATMSLRETQVVANIMDAVMKQLGVIYFKDQ